jgi:hypothetical protein
MGVELRGAVQAAHERTKPRARWGREGCHPLTSENVAAAAGSESVAHPRHADDPDTPVGGASVVTGPPGLTTLSVAPRG